MTKENQRDRIDFTYKNKNIIAFRKTNIFILDYREPEEVETGIERIFNTSFLASLLRTLN